MIERIQLTNFRSYRQADFALGELNVLIGSNGSGKSNLLSLFDLLGDGTRHRNLNGNIRNKIGGFPDLRHYHASQDDTVFCELAFSSPHNKTLYYSVELSSRAPAGYTISSEVLSRPPVADVYTNRFKFLEVREGEVIILKQKETDAPSDLAHFENLHQELLLPQLLNSARYPAQVEAYHHLRELNVFQGFGDKELETMRSAQLIDVVDPLRLATDGSNLISVLNTLRENPQHQDTLELLNETMRDVFPYFQQFDLPSMGGGRAVLAYRDQNFRTRSINAHLMSDGFLRFLGLTLLLILPNPPRVIAIDEPEIGMHPKMIQVFGNLLVEASRHTQIIISTHSPQLLDMLPADSLLIVERIDGESRIQHFTDRVDEETRNLWLKEYAPGYLWTHTTLIEE